MEECRCILSRMRPEHMCNLPWSLSSQRRRPAMRDEFYVGYATNVPERIARTSRRAVIALAVLSIAACALLIAAQQPFARATFEFQQPRNFTGWMETDPYPALL